ncbi:MAG TPA: DegT/DnrJ/EryC1/StrS family aminotransferase [Pyrinomonadaceae bacterium]|jgi:dTDP-4-amino-4,6-dideoxygalactose transaminase|nr:DegT/DnrJ/EryC1/StrS family aminotransferase [Pyrinomonadaceae bacterium]
MKKRPALAGGSPLFENPVRVARPALPDFEALAPEMRDVLASGFLSKGHRLRAFEEALAEHLGVRHAVAVSSGTTGLMLTYQALGLKGEVVVPSFTFMATISALVWVGARPVFADADPRTANLDPSAAEAAINDHTTAIVAVHNHGNPADVDELRALARRRGLRLVFDAAHALGSLYKGEPVGPQGDANVFSLSFTKLLVAGEGGVVATDDDALAEQIRYGREYGNTGNYDSAFAGLNGRMGELAALLALRGLPALEAGALHRNRLAELYREELADVPGLSFQQVRADDRSSYKDFSVKVEADAFGLTRDELAAALEAENVETRKYYDPPAHRHTAYRRFAPPDEELPNTMLLAARSLSLPVWSDMEPAVVSRVCEAVRAAHESAAEIRAALGAEGEGVACATGRSV